MAFWENRSAREHERAEITELDEVKWRGRTLDQIGHVSMRKTQEVEYEDRGDHT
jgi:hypothetical protein